MALPEPISREENYLGVIAGQETAVLPETPISRYEFYLAKIAGEDVETPAPISRIEHYLDYISQHGGQKPEQSKTLTLGAAAPSTVTPDSGKVLSSVPVVLDTSVIKAANIAKGVTMLGIPGAHEGGSPVLQTKTLTVTENGTQQVTPDAGFDGIGLINLITNVAGGGYVNDAIFDALSNLYPGNVARCSVRLSDFNSAMMLTLDEPVTVDMDSGFMCLFFGETNDDLRFLFARCGNPYDYANTIYFVVNEDETVMNAGEVMIYDVVDNTITVNANFSSAPDIDAYVSGAVFVAFQ